jgi:hypothetical protein
MTDVTNRMKKISNHIYIDGQLRKSRSTDVTEVIDPAELCPKVGDGLIRRL